MPHKDIHKYSVPSDEDFEPGSNQEVLKNFLAIKSREIMEEIEYRELQRTELELIDFFDSKHYFTADDICNIHELWLGDIYPFAGKYRTVSLSKDGFPFASPSFIAKAMNVFDQKYLKKFTPCNFENEDELALVLAIVHVELILIHPFREGNGRTARLLANLMAIQSNKPLLSFTSISQISHPDGFRKYIHAIHAGVNEEYKPIQQIFKSLLQNKIT